MPRKIVITAKYIIVFCDWSTHVILLLNENEVTELFYVVKNRVEIDFKSIEGLSESDNFSSRRADQANDRPL